MCFRRVRNIACTAALAVLVALGGALGLPAAPGRAEDERQVILERMVAIRGLPMLAEVPVELVSRDQARAERQAAFDDPRTRAWVLTSQKLMLELGLLQPGQDLRAILAERLSGSIAGYYSPAARKMYVVSDLGRFGPREEIVLSHELTHALQDQHFDLDGLRRAARASGDRTAALRALVEGDARVTETEYARLHLPEDIYRRFQQAADCAGRPIAEGVPLAIRDENYFPYCEGAVFARALMQADGYAAINAAYADPPRSTEQVLHPEKYLRREAPVEVELPDLAAGLGPDWAVLRTDVLGELDVRILLQQFSDPPSAAAGAAGWGGGRYALLEHANGAPALAVRLLWDDAAEADEFLALYTASLERRFGARLPISAEPAFIATPVGRAMSVSRNGSSVDILIATDRPAVERLAELLSESGLPE
jgi:hypothetical protein